MSIIVDWIPTEHAAYSALYAVHHKELTVFGTHTCMEGCEWHSRPYLMTEWGFKDADAPLLRSICDGDREDGTWTYYVAKVSMELEHGDD